MQSRRGLLATLGVVLAGCQSAGAPSADADTATPTPARSPTTPTAADHWYPHPRPTGNRRLDGAGAVRDATPVDIEIGKPRWLVALPAPDGSDWIVTHDDGRAARYRVTDGAATREAEYEAIGDRVPVVRRRASGESQERGVSLVRPPAEVSPMAPPIFVDGGRTRAAIGTDGDLFVTSESGTDRLAVDALPDGRIVHLGGGRVALLGDTTDRYRHGALGDEVEGGSVVVVDTATSTVETRTGVGPPAVVEGLGPIAADLDGDGERELLVALSDAADGARIAAFRPDGRRIGTGPIHGSGWRHALAVAPFGPRGRPELAVVRKPHVEHVLEFYRIAGGSLNVTATVRGFRSHTYGSRILDGALAADFDDDGRVELLVPTTSRDELAAVRRAEGGARVAWSLSLDGQAHTNVTGVAADGHIAVGVGTAAGVRVWQG
jgi:hypothetical protein